MRRIYESFISNHHFQDLNPLIVGMEECAPSHSFGPAIRPYTLIHFVVKGKGIYKLKGIEYSVHAGEAFLILPGDTTTYTADKEEPWTYQWIGFDGKLSEDFKQLPPVFSVSEWTFHKLRYDKDQIGALEYKLAAGLFYLYAELFTQQPPKKHYIQQVQDFIQASYMQHLTVKDIAHQINLDRRYLSRLFKQNTGQTIQEYIITIRINEAKHYLRQGYSVKECAMRCGYDDASTFSRIFKHYVGCSPALWKNNLSNNFC